MSGPFRDRRATSGPALALSPVRGVPIVVESVDPAITPWRSITHMRVSPDEPVFAGHYPDFPIFPGVCLLECAHKGAVATASPTWGELDLVEVTSARFSGAVFPGDEPRFEYSWWTDELLHCRCVATTERGVVATLSLRYRTEVPA